MAQPPCAGLDGRLDRLSSLIERFRVHAGIVMPGADASDEANFHVYRTLDAGLLLVFMPYGSAPARSAPTTAGKDPGERLVAAQITISGAGHHLVMALPERIAIALKDAPELAAVVEPLVAEVVQPRCGGLAVFHRLCEVVVIRLLRHALERGAADVGLLAGLAHPRLATALVSVHEAPQKHWTLEQLAETAGMSRTQFAVTFKEVLGITPGGYLSNWRLEIARTELESGTPVKTVARMCGFSSAAAFSRAFTRRFGHAPKMERHRAA
ncbi:MAG: AraC family transcriptional regulator [Roseibium sp.]|nr:AraC family transcriptional regulator [Roseibium sp.]